jgi:hypothetical protein
MILQSSIDLSREVRRLLSELDLTPRPETDSRSTQQGTNKTSASTDKVKSPPPKPDSAKVTDELIFAVMHLIKASSINTSPNILPLSRLEVTDGSFGLFSPPLFLRQLQSLHLWGRSCPYQEQGKELDAQIATHVTALEQLIAMKGGLRNINTPGFANAFHLFDVIESSRRLGQPKFDLPEQSAWFLEHMEIERIEALQVYGPHTLSTLLEGTPLTEILQDVYILASWVTRGMELTILRQTHHARPRNSLARETPSPEDMSILRNLIEYRLLAYSPVSDNRFEVMAHTALLTFMHNLLFPLPHRQTTISLIQRITAFFSGPNSKLHFLSRSTEELKFLVWVLMVGAIATSESEGHTRLFFVEHLALAVNELGISSWTELKHVLLGYLWIDWGCDVGGLTIWKMIVAYLRRVQVRHVAGAIRK